MRQTQKLVALSKTAAQAATLQESRRIMFELHDGILQSRATLILRLEASRGRLPESPREAIQVLQATEALTGTTTNGIRTFLAGKTDHPVISGTLLQRLQGELRLIQERLGREMIFDCEQENLNLPAEIEREVYYVLRAGLTDITRHAHATGIQLRANQFTTAFEVSLEDYGVGLDLSTARAAMEWNCAA